MTCITAELEPLISFSTSEDENGKKIVDWYRIWYTVNVRPTNERNMWLWEKLDGCCEIQINYEG